MSALRYTLPNLIRFLSIVDQLHCDREIIISQLLIFVEDGLEQTQLGGANKWFCDRKTFDKYRVLTRSTTASNSFTHAIKAIQEPAFHLIVEYLEILRPDISEVGVF